MPGAPSSDALVPCSPRLDVVVAAWPTELLANPRRSSPMALRTPSGKWKTIQSNLVQPNTHLFLVASLLLLVRHLLLLAWHLFLVAMHLFLVASSAVPASLSFLSDWTFAPVPLLMDNTWQRPLRFWRFTPPFSDGAVAWSKSLQDPRYPGRIKPQREGIGLKERFRSRLGTRRASERPAVLVVHLCLGFEWKEIPSWPS